MTFDSVKKCPPLRGCNKIETTHLNEISRDQINEKDCRI